ncbi:MAG: hypothetical protein B7Z62_08290 [Deltaproteobacteria bacterium 37-65-8]|nr:MAG: hypothetical protein B7Z62_08290 [Deltaproteobacteria bacterium 37-65-8]HQT95256.1 hypothetical protein [Thermoanaerobaculaceae bacterium]
MKTINMRSISTIAICFLWAFLAYADRPCVTNFSESGDWGSGKKFQTWVEFAAPDETAAFQAIGRFVATQGMLDLNANKDLGLITAYQDNDGKKSPFTVTFSKPTTGHVRVEVMFQLAGGLRSPAAAVRDWLCQVAEVGVPTDQRAGSGAAETSGTMLRTASGEVPLAATVGQLRKGGFGPVLVIFYDFPGAHAPTRTDNKQPSIIVRVKEDPQKGYLLVRLDSNAKDDRRSVKMGSAGKLLKIGVTGKGDLAPDLDWTMPFTTSQESPGVWVVTPSAPLKPGEYGLWEIEGYGASLFGVN